MKNQSIVVIIGLGVLVVGAIAYSFTNTAPQDKSMSMNMGSQDDVPAGMHRMPDGSLMGNPTSPTSKSDSGIGMMGGMDHSMMMVKSERE